MNTGFAHGGNVFAVARALGIPPEDILDFSASINPLGLAPAVKEAVIAALERLVHYPDSGAPGLQEALAGHHEVSSENVAVANGSTELIYLLPRLLSGRRALIVAPPFGEYAHALALHGWETGYFALKPEDGFALDLNALAKSLAEGWDALFLCNPNNPAGTLLSCAEVAAVLDLCRVSGTFLVLDEAFIDFREEQSAKHLLIQGGGMVLRSMTKFFAIPGLRLGYALGTADVIRRLKALQGPWSVNTLAQAAGIAALADVTFRNRTLELVRKETEFLLAGLASFPALTVFPTAANYLLVKIGNGISAGELRDRLLLQRILIRDCGNFEGLDGSFFRIAVRTRPENIGLLAAVRTVLG